MEAHICNKRELWSPHKKRCLDRRQALSYMASDAEEKIADSKIVNSIIGIGSFYRGIKTAPKDIDMVVKLNVPFDDKRNFKLSDTIEKIKNKFRDEKGDTLVNIFMEDSKGNKINSVDIWYVQYHNWKWSDIIPERNRELSAFDSDWKKGKLLYKKSDRK